MKSSWLSFMLGGMTVLGIWTLTTNQGMLMEMKKCMCDTAQQAVQKFKDMGNKNCSCESTTNN